MTNPVVSARRSLRNHTLSDLSDTEGELTKPCKPRPQRDYEDPQQPNSRSFAQQCQQEPNESENVHDLPNTMDSCTPKFNMVSGMRHRLEQQLVFGSGSTPQNGAQRKISPNLANLQMTPGSRVRDKRTVLSKKHHEAKSRTEQFSIGGGVCIWPQMDNMRLTAIETAWLVMYALGLSLATLVLFRYIHGEVVISLVKHNYSLSKFSKLHVLDTSGGNTSFSASVLAWHTAFQSAMEDIQVSFNVSLSNAPASYQFCVLLYLFGVATLLYYLADNMLAKNKLTPRRIKTWVCLLVVVAVWTLMCLQLLVLAQHLEAQVQNNVHIFAQQLGDLVYQQLDLSMFRNVLLYWQTRCLPPTTRGTLNVLGLVAVQDISYYLQYYSLPVLTALVTPVLRLIMALIEVYGVKPHE